MPAERPGEAAGRAFYESQAENSTPWSALSGAAKRGWISRTPLGFFVRAYSPGQRGGVGPPSASPLDTAPLAARKIA